MTTGGARRARTALVPALLGAGAVAGCAEPGARTPAGGPPSASPAPRTTPPEDLCTRLVAHGSRQVLDGETYGDCPSMGLSNGQCEILREVMDAARAERAAAELIDRRVREGCVDGYRTGGPSNGRWQ